MDEKAFPTHFLRKSRNSWLAKGACFEFERLKMVPKSSPGRLGRPLGAHWGALGSLLGRPWALLSTLGALSGHSWVNLGAIMSALGIAFERPRASQIRRALVAPGVLNELEGIMNVFMYYECLTGGRLMAQK